MISGVAYCSAAVPTRGKTSGYFMVNFWRFYTKVVVFFSRPISKVPLTKGVLPNALEEKNNKSVLKFGQQQPHQLNFQNGLIRSRSLNKNPISQNQVDKILKRAAFSLTERDNKISLKH